MRCGEVRCGVVWCGVRQDVCTRSWGACVAGDGNGCGQSAIACTWRYGEVLATWRWSRRTYTKSGKLLIAVLQR